MLDRILTLSRPYLSLAHVAVSINTEMPIVLEDISGNKGRYPRKLLIGIDEMNTDLFVHSIGNERR